MLGDRSDEVGGSDLVLDGSVGVVPADEQVTGSEVLEDGADQVAGGSGDSVSVGECHGTDTIPQIPSCPRVYIGGPMTGLPEFNYPVFNAVAAQLRAEGREVVNPAEQDSGSTGKPWDFYMRLALRGLLDCDEIMLLPGWEHSRGARLEHQVARELGMKVTLWEPTS